MLSSSKSKGTTKGSAPKKSKNDDVVEGLPSLQGVNTEKEEEATVVPPENYITVSIGTISNIRSQLLSQESCVRFRIQFGNDFLSDSPLISISDNGDLEAAVHWECSVPCFTSKTEDLDFLTSNPIVVSVSEEEKKYEDQLPENPTKLVEFSPFAYSTLDLLPLILGEAEMCQTLLLDIVRQPKSAKGKIDASTTEKKSKAGKISDQDKKGRASKRSESFKSPEKEEEIPTMKPEITVTDKVPVVEGSSIALMPRISVTIGSQQPIVTSREIINDSNLIFLTIESIYNLPPNFDGDSMDFQAATWIPNEFDREQVVHFGQGFFKRESDTVRTKRWLNIDHIPGKSSHTQYTISEDLFPVRNKLGVDLCRIMSADAPRIEWNKVKRSWLSSSGCEYLGEYLKKTKTWMIEVMITPKVSGQKSNSKTKGEEYPMGTDKMHFAAYFDVGAMTYPGMQGVRVASQLFTYCKEDAETKCGVRGKTILSDSVPVVPSGIKEKAKEKTKPKADKKGNKGKGKTKESQSSKKQPASTLKSSGVVHDDEAAEVVHCEVRPWVNDKGAPVFVILQLEFLKPLTASITNEELIAKVDALIPNKPTVPEKVMAARKAGEEHTKFINNLVKRLAKEYHKFICHRKKMNLPLNAADQNTKDFYQFLKETGVISQIKTQLSESVGKLIKDKFGYDIKNQQEQDIKVKHKFVSELFIRLFEEVNTIINTFHDTTVENEGRYELEQSQLKRIDIESRTLGFSSLQRQLFLRNRNEADIGTQFVHSSQCDDLESSMDFTLDLLSSDKDCREGLLFYATLLTKKGDFKTAKLFFQVVVAKHPQYLIGGYIFSLFYQMMGNKTAAEIVWEKTRKYTAESQGKDDGDLASAYPELLDWDANMYKRLSVHLKCVELILYVKVMALDFAYLALENELERNGPSEPYYYYLSVCYYRTGRYQEASRILQAILDENPRINHVRRLIGHCQFEMGLRDAAVKHYQFVVETSESGAANHLVHLRLGDYYLDIGDYESAKSIYFESCNYTPTATSWLGVGIACYMQGDYDESEQALTEANYLDRTVALVWAYLALINLRFFREDKFEQCYCRALRYNINNDKVMSMIKDLVFACGFSTPKLIHFEQTDNY